MPVSDCMEKSSDLAVHTTCTEKTRDTQEVKVTDLKVV